MLVGDLLGSADDDPVPARRRPAGAAAGAWSAAPGRRCRGPPGTGSRCRSTSASVTPGGTARRGRTPAGRRRRSASSCARQYSGWVSSLNSLVQRAASRLGGADDRADAGQDLERGRGRGRRGRARLEVGVERLRVRQRLLRGEDRLGVPGREALAVLRRPGLHEHRPALRRARQVERARDRKCLPTWSIGWIRSVSAQTPACLVARRRRRPPSCPRAS